MKLLTGLVLITLVITNVFGQEWVSPCPDLFQYDPAGPTGDSWEGTITLKTDQDLSGIWLRLVLDRPPIEIAVSIYMNNTVYISQLIIFLTLKS